MSTGVAASGPTQTLEGDGQGFLLLLRQLRSSETGTEFIYEALGQLASKYSLTSADVVVDDDVLDGQIFRLGRMPTTHDSATSLLGAGPGLFTSPDVVPPLTKDAFVELCSLALCLHRAQHGGVRDPLTGLARRRPFNEALRGAAAQSARYGWSFTLMIADVANSSDQRGASPEELRTAGRVMAKALRTGDLAGRVSGDKFAVLLGNADPSSADAFMKRVRQEMSSEPRQVEINAGSALAPVDSVDPVELYRIAGMNLSNQRDENERRPPEAQERDEGPISWTEP